MQLFCPPAVGNVSHAGHTLALHEFRDEGATHAWEDTYVPDYVWFGIDPTNNCRVSDRHVKIACGRNFNDCTPVKGTYKAPSNYGLVVLVGMNNKKQVADPVRFQ